jgi:GH25 family lysozyme M1 (1,4-beta-N-acetylmuramidase)
VALAIACTWLATPIARAAEPGAHLAHRPHVAPQPPPDALPGIDVSHHQDAIDWTQVAGSGVRFAIAKATEGTGFIDPMYSINRAGAMANGIVFGAYHFARPDLHPFDPIPEADHYVDTAQLGQGNIIPVLDLERSGDLTPTQLTTWILGWLDEVTARTGVRPMVYTSPNGWKDRTGDSTAVADAGYTFLWIAHWNVATPTVPANDWQGNGWTFWQYDDCGHVPGIVGCVDLDFSASADLTPVIIPSPDTVAPVASIATPTGVGGPITVAFSEIVHHVTSASLDLRILSTGVPVPAALTCASKAGERVGCDAGNVIVAVLQPTDLLLPGESYRTVVDPPEAVSPIVDRSGNAAAMTEADFAAPTQVEQASEAIRYGWRSVSAHNAFGGSYAMDHLEGATASFSFKGRTVTWYTVTGPAQGKASVSIDGHDKGTFDLYAPSMSFKVARSFAHLARGDHTITIRVLERKGAKQGADTQVAVDAFAAAGKVTWNPDLQLSWGGARAAAASGGSVAVSDLAGSTATFAFVGSGVQWQTMRGPHQGRAQIFVDGALAKTVDNFAATPAPAVRSISGLAAGPHEIRIVVLGMSRPAAAGTEISIDAFTVIP